MATVSGSTFYPDTVYNEISDTVTGSCLSATSCSCVSICLSVCPSADICLSACCQPSRPSHGRFVTRPAYHYNNSSSSSSSSSCCCCCCPCCCRRRRRRRADERRRRSRCCCCCCCCCYGSSSSNSSSSSSSSSSSHSSSGDHARPIDHELLPLTNVARPSIYSTAHVTRMTCWSVGFIRNSKIMTYSTGGATTKFSGAKS